MLEARGDDLAAWDAFEAGNALKHQLLSTGAAASRPDVVARENARSIERIKTVFTPAFVAQHAGQGDRVTRPIFVVGMPRSGSSLIEQILSSHPQIQGMGESGALWGAMEDRFPYPPDAPKEDDHFRQLARRYHRPAGAWLGGPPSPVDKTLDNHLHVGMLHLMFPRATILHAVRDPMDTGVACWRQLFARGNETLYDLAEIGAEQRRYAAMMQHWARVLPGRVIDVGYEALIAEPEAQIRWLVMEACALPWSPECLKFHLTRTAVSTASAEQVRQPIFRTSVERWRRYEARLPGPWPRRWTERERSLPGVSSDTRSDSCRGRRATRAASRRRRAYSTMNGTGGRPRRRRSTPTDCTRPAPRTRRRRAERRTPARRHAGPSRAGSRPGRCCYAPIKAPPDQPQRTTRRDASASIVRPRQPAADEGAQDAADQSAGSRVIVSLYAILRRPGRVPSGILIVVALGLVVVCGTGSLGPRGRRRVLPGWWGDAALRGARLSGVAI